MGLPEQTFSERPRITYDIQDIGLDTPNSDILAKRSAFNPFPEKAGQSIDVLDIPHWFRHERIDIPSTLYAPTNSEFDRYLRENESWGPHERALVRYKATGEIYLVDGPLRLPGDNKYYEPQKIDKRLAKVLEEIYSLPKDRYAWTPLPDYIDSLAGYLVEKEITQVFKDQKGDAYTLMWEWFSLPPDEMKKDIPGLLRRILGDVIAINETDQWQLRFRAFQLAFGFESDKSFYDYVIVPPKVKVEGSERYEKVRAEFKTRLDSGKYTIERYREAGSVESLVGDAFPQINEFLKRSIAEKRYKDQPDYFIFNNVPGKDPGHTDTLDLEEALSEISYFTGEWLNQYMKGQALLSALAYTSLSETSRKRIGIHIDQVTRYRQQIERFLSQFRHEETTILDKAKEFFLVAST